MAGHEEFDARLAGADTALTSNFDAPTGSQPSPTPQQAGGGGQTAEETLRLLIEFANRGISPEPEEEEEGPLVPPATLKLMMALVRSIDPSLNLSPSVLKGFLSTVTDEDGRVTKDVFDSAARQDLTKFVTERKKERIAGEKTERGIESDQAKAGFAAEKREREAEDRDREAVEREAQAEQDRQAFDQQQEVIDQRDIPKTTEAMIAKALSEGDFDLARRVNDFRNEPTNAEKLRLALDFATSPADVFTLSAIADGVFPGQFDKGGISGKLPVAPALQKAFDDVFNPQDPFEGRQRGPEAAPASQQEPFAPTAPEAFRSPQESGVPLQRQPASDPGLPPPAQQLPQFDLEDDFGVEGPFRRSELQDTGFEEGGAFGPLPSRNVEPIFPNRQQQATTPIGGSDVADPFGVGGNLNPFNGFKVAGAGGAVGGGGSPLPDTFDEEGGPFPFVTDASHTPTHQKLVTSPTNAIEFDTAKFAGSGGGGRAAAPRFPTPEPINRPGLIPEIPAQAPTLPPQQQQQIGGPRTDRGFIPEGTPTFQHQFPGQEPRRLPQRFRHLFGGIKDASVQLPRPDSFLGARGLPRLDPGTFGRLTAGEQDAFIRLAQERGLDPRDVFKEIESGRPAQPRFSRVTSAAGRSR